MAKLDDPPMAALVMMELIKAFLTNMSESFRSSLTISTILIPERWASTFLLASAAGMAALCGNDRPKDSTMLAMVEAVPITAQCPWLRHIPASASAKAWRLIFPDLLDSLNRQRSDVPMS